ncbi:MAG: DUF4178 domain-containing protein [Gammaproteobacteria bacterium]|nr:DUF4178 domain-containing protein [Gammaproteobacteria bacterium]MDH5653203.1 DUF4178 domain-containing protein [Gammaproteobacteria bacterium]
MSATKLKSINCTQCAAPLSLRGGRYVESINCGYCGAVLDAKHEYSVIKNFVKAKRPYLPLKLGMSGKIKNVEFTIIGVIEFQHSYDHSRWIEYLLFSPTHGYAWLEHDHGHYVFSRRVRDLPDGVMQQYKTTFRARDRKFQVYDFYDATVTFVEGELTWIAEQKDKVHVTEGIAPPWIYTIEKTAKEKEYLFGEYMDYKEIEAIFKPDSALLEPEGVHGAQPYIPHPFVAGLGRAGLFFAPVALLLWLAVVFMGSGQPVFQDRIPADEYLGNQQGATRNFTITNPDRLVELNLYSGLSNAWGWYDIEILQHNEPLFSMSQLISYYHGREGGENWSEGSRSATALFRLPEAGEYSLRVWGEGGTGEYDTTAQRAELDINITEGIIVSRYYLFLLIFFALMVYSRRHFRNRFEKQRWGDDDDD